jgi:hypothetical protein
MHIHKVSAGHHDTLGRTRPGSRDGRGCLFGPIEVYSLASYERIHARMEHHEGAGRCLFLQVACKALAGIVARRKPRSRVGSHGPNSNPIDRTYIF